MSHFFPEGPLPPTFGTFESLFPKIFNKNFKTFGSAETPHTIKKQNKKFEGFPKWSHHILPLETVAWFDIGKFPDIFGQFETCKS